ncbi:MAG TPA: hypothetical protein VF631_09185 [Allosphingosinicella sp.]|uniref:hypothetical protein n=1 Tax=Allosphingosinicella sp. TaxID=2823234 RepID=UPI002F288BC4
MSNSTQSIARFRLADPEDFLNCLWSAHFGDNIPPATREKFWERDLAITTRLHPHVFTTKYGLETADAVNELVALIAAGKHHNPAEPYHVPRAWFSIFHSAFKAGLITDITWGRAAGCIYISSGTGPTDSGNHNQAVLAGFRDACSFGMIDQNELDIWLSLPDKVRLYRGSCATSIDGAANGISWTDSRWMAGVFSRYRMAERRGNGVRSGIPRVLEAVVPKEAIFAVFSHSDDYRELLVDYEKLPRSAIVNPGLHGGLMRAFAAQSIHAASGLSV